MDTSLLGSLTPGALREAFPAMLARFVAEESARSASLPLLSKLLGERTDAELQSMLEHLRTVGTKPDIYRAEPTCQRLVRAWGSVLLQLQLRGEQHLVQAVDAGPTLIIGNHLSYFDTCVLDHALVQAGHEQVAATVVAAAGPKVYGDTFRRFVTSSLNTLPVPQSTSFAHTAQLSPRELMRRAQASLHTAHDAIRSGLTLLIYPEGSRSRSGRLGPFLPAVRRYLDLDGLQVVPVAVSGTEHFLPVDDLRLHPGPVQIAIGEPILVAQAGPRATLERAHDALAGLLPAEYRPGTQRD